MILLMPNYYYYLNFGVSNQTRKLDIE
jgi:hypothetical protein